MCDNFVCECVSGFVRDIYAANTAIRTMGLVFMRSAFVLSSSGVTKTFTDINSEVCVCDV